MSFNGMMGNPNPMMNNTNGMMGNPTMGNMMGNMGNPMMGNMNGMMGNPNPMMNNNQMFMNNQNQFPSMQMNNMLMNNMNNQVMMNQMPMQTMAMNQMNMMGNMNPQMQDQNQFINNNPQKDEITLLFGKANEQEKPIGVQCKQNDLMSDVFNRYWSKIGVKNPPEAKFIFNTKTINPTLSVAECGLLNNNIIHVIITKGIEGAKIFILN